MAIRRTADALRHLNIAAAMKSGTDVLGEFYEAFLKYGNGAKDLGIVLTPRHITRWAARALGVTADDIVLDPTAGTGGFLVSAYDKVRRGTSDETKFEFFRKHRIFGVEQQPKVAALAVINMIFRGDGSTNIIDENVLTQSLIHHLKGQDRTAKFQRGPSATPGATKVLMNPPFALSATAEKEYEFVEHALQQLEDGGLLFAVLPAPVLVKTGGPLSWRRDRLLSSNTLRAVISFPEDLFYPVSIDTVGIIVEKGRPHRMEKDEVIWARVKHDGYLKVKGKRLLSKRVPNDLERVTLSVEGGINNPSTPIESVPALIKKCPIDARDTLVELLPQVYLDEPVPLEEEIAMDMSHAVREYLSFAIRSGDSATVEKALQAAKVTELPNRHPHKFELRTLTDLFGSIGDGILKGSIHALNVELPGATPVISSSTEQNGILGFFDLDKRWPRYRHVISVASNGTPLTSYYHPYEIVPKDDVFVCVPPTDMPLASIFYLLTAMNSLTWRFSYYRKCYLNKIDKVQVWVPTTKGGTIDHGWLEDVASSCPGWAQLEKLMDHWTPQPWRALGRRTWNS